MATKVRPPSTDAEKLEVGEIDTRAPFESVKAAVSLFGEVRFSSDKSAARKPKAPQAEVVTLQVQILNMRTCMFAMIHSHSMNTEDTCSNP